MKEEQFNPVDSLKHINAMIREARHGLNDNGHLFLLWGWVIFCCAMFQFMAYRFQWMDKPFLAWLITLPTLLYQLIFITRKRKTHRVKTFVHRMLASIWLVFVVMLLMLWYTLIFRGEYSLFYTIILMLYGMPTILSGVVLKERALIWGGVWCFILSVVSVHAEIYLMLLLVALAVLGAWIIPGYIIRNKYVNQSNIEASLIKPYSH